LGIDFFATHIEAVPAGFDKLLLAGVIDGRSSVAEEPREIAAFVDRLEVERIALVPNGDLQYVSQPVAQEKVARLGKAKTARPAPAAWAAAWRGLWGPWSFPGSRPSGGAPICGARWLRRAQ